MKLYIKAARTVEQLTEQEGKELRPEIIKTLIELDPTSDYENGKGGKYCPWIFRQYKKGNIKESDFTNLSDALMMFAKDYKKFPKADLNQYQTFDEFLQDSHAVGNRELTDKEKKKMLKKQAHHANSEDKEFIVEDGEWEVWKPLTYAGSISLARTGGQKASWCTAYEGNDNYWRSYTAKGPLYIFINTADPSEKYQLHFPTNSWYDINDSSKGMNAFYRFCAEHPAIAAAFELKSQNGVLTRANEIVEYDGKAAYIEIPEGVEKLPNLKFPENCKKVHLPSTITVIPAKAFEGTGIETVTFDAVTEIKNSAFMNSSIVNIDLSKIVKIGSNAFRFCEKLGNVAFNPEGVSVGAYAFANSSCKGTIKVNQDTTKISLGSFDDCPNMTIVWDGPDAANAGDAYEFSNIGLLVLDKDTCPLIYKENIDYVKIQSPKGVAYEV